MGVSGPIFDDRTFKFIQIPDRRGTHETATYESLGYAPYIPAKFDDAHPHLDPDPSSFTYSETKGKTRTKQIEKLNPGDYLLFAASLAPSRPEGYHDRSKVAISRLQTHRMAKYLVGSYAIQGIYAVNRKGRSEPLISPEDSVLALVKSRLERNAHFKTLDSHDFVCAVGEKEEHLSDFLLKRAIRFTEFGSPFRPTRFGIDFQGSKPFPRGWKWLTEDQVKVGLSRTKLLTDS